MKNPGLKSNVFSMYKSKIERENLLLPKIDKDVEIEDKYGVKHTIDIYFEFVQMNNLERTIIKTISSREVTQEDIEKFKSTVDNLNFFSKNIIFYDTKVSDDALKIADITNIELKKFDLQQEIINDSIQALKVMLPDKDTIGDPFWVLMETKNSVNTGNYYCNGNNIPLFTSKREANDVCNKINGNNTYQVFGVSQRQLEVLVNLSVINKVNFGIVLPRFIQPDNTKVLSVLINSRDIEKFYIRSEKND